MPSGVKNPTIQSHLDNLFSAVLEEQKKYMGVKPADPVKAKEQVDRLKQYEDSRGRGFFYSYLSTGRGHGPFSELVDGSVKYDLINGIGFNLLGHSHPALVKSCLEAACVDTLMAGNLQPYLESAELSEYITSLVKKSKLKNFWFAGSGSFANDIACKILWQKCAPKYGIIAFEKAFAGRSVATQEITYSEGYREGMPKYLDIFHVPHYDQNDPAGATQKTINALEKVYADHGDKICAISMELIQGEGGFVYGPRDYYTAVFDWAKNKGLYIWVDEVQTFGRTQELFAFQTFGLEEYVDVVTIAKVLQVGGVLYSDELNPKPGLIAGTFNGSIPSINAASKVIKFLVEGNFYGNNGRMNEIEQKFISKLQGLAKGSCQGKIGYAGGKGTMISFEVGDSGKDTTDKYIKKLFDNGIISFKAGANPTRVRFLLPICLTDEHIDEIMQIIEKTANEVL